MGGNRGPLGDGELDCTLTKESQIRFHILCDMGVTMFKTQTL